VNRSDTLERRVMQKLWDVCNDVHDIFVGCEANWAREPDSKSCP
jgi:hypothetical protein